MTPAGLKKRRHRIIVPSHNEFVIYWELNVIDIYFVGDVKHLMPDDSRNGYNFVYNLYKYLPLIATSLLVYFSKDFWLLLVIPIYYLGGLIAKRKWMLLYLYFMFCVGIWIKEGFSWHQYITILYFSMLSGYIFYKWADMIMKNGIASLLCFSEKLYNMIIEHDKMVIIKKLSFYSKVPNE